MIFCVLAHNAEATLERCLRSIKPHADLLIMVEGRVSTWTRVPRATPHSTDRTIEIAQKYVDKILQDEDRPEPLMRDKYLMGRKGDYYFVIDADEELCGDFRKEEVMTEAPVWAVWVREPWSYDKLCLRIFQHLPGVRHGPGQVPLQLPDGRYMDSTNFPVKVAEKFWLNHLREE